MILIRSLASAVLLLLASPAARADQEPVDLELVMAVDASGSITTGALEFQLRGHAAAFRSAEVAESLTVGGTRSSPTAIPTGGYNFGRNEISGLSFNYLKVSSYDLR